MLHPASSTKVGNWSAITGNRTQLTKAVYKLQYSQLLSLKGQLTRMRWFYLCGKFETCDQRVDDDPPHDLTLYVLLRI